MVAFHQSSGLCSAHPGRGVYNRIWAEAVAIIVPDASTSNPLTDAVPASIPMIHSLIYAIPSRSYPLHAPFTILCRSDSAFQQRLQTLNKRNQSVHNVLLAILEGFTRKSTVRTLTLTRRLERAFQNHHGNVGDCWYTCSDYESPRRMPNENVSV